MIETRLSEDFALFRHELEEERQALEKRQQRLLNERTRLLQAHYAGAIPLPFLRALSYSESSFRPDLVHPQSHATGLFQITTSALKGFNAANRTSLALQQLTVGSETDLSKPLRQLVESLSKRGMVIVISDLLDDPESVVRGLRHFQYRGTDVLVLHVLDRDETDFPFERAARFEDLETAEEVVAVPRTVRSHYLKQIGDLIELRGRR